MSISILIVEDEILIAKDISYTIEDLGYDVYGIFSKGEEAFTALSKGLPDVVLMDIHLEGDWDGIETAIEIRKKYDLPIIFLTAHNDVTTISRAKKAEPDAYISKPFDERNLYAAIELAIFKFGNKKTPLEDSTEVLPTLAGNPDSLFVKVKNRLVKVSVNDIKWVKAEGSYSQIGATDKTYYVSSAIGAIEKKINNTIFVRVHRSHLVNINHIDAIEENTLLIGKDAIPVSKGYKDRLFALLTQL